ncbi:unnamed protein product, partial [marine sediment metagenome]
MVNFKVGYKQIDDFVHYFVNGLPVYCHETEDKNGYRYVMATLVNHKFCSIKELSEALGVPRKEHNWENLTLKEVNEKLKKVKSDLLHVKLKVKIP